MDEKIKVLSERLHEHNLLMLKVREVDCEGNRENAKTIIQKKRKYTYLDVGDGVYSRSGKYLIDNNTGVVYSISAYGVKNRLVGTLEKVIKGYDEDIKNLRAALDQKEETGSFGSVAIAY